MPFLLSSFLCKHGFQELCTSCTFFIVWLQLPHERRSCSATSLFTIASLIIRFVSDSFRRCYDTILTHCTQKTSVRTSWSAKHYSDFLQNGFSQRLSDAFTLP